MGRPSLPPGVLAAAADRRGGATEVAAQALDGLLEVAGEPDRLERAVAVLLAGQPAMAPMWHLARAARAPDPAAALAELRRRLDADADAAVAAAAAWLRRRLAGRPGGVATVSHSSLVDQVLAQMASVGPVESRDTPGSSVRGSAPRRGSVAEPAQAVPGSSTAPPPDPAVGLVGADAVGPGALLNAAGTGELTARLPTLVVTTAIKLVPQAAFERLQAPGFEVVPLAAVTAVVVGPEVLAPAEAGRRAAALSPGPVT
jgi:hypothetical protein